MNGDIGIDGYQMDNNCVVECTNTIFLQTFFQNTQKYFTHLVSPALGLPQITIIRIVFDGEICFIFCR